MTGTKRERPELENTLSHLAEGDTVVVESLSRLGRSTKDLPDLTVPVAVTAGVPSVTRRCSSRH